MLTLSRTKQINCFAKNHGWTNVQRTCNHKVSYHTNCVWLYSWGKENVCVCVCARLLEQSVSLWYKALLSQLKIQCHLPLQSPGLFVPSHLDQNRGSSVAP